MKKPVEIKLRHTRTDKQDEWGNPIETFSYKDIIAIKKSVSRSEFYRAATLGKKPSIVFEVYKDEFNNSDGIIFNGVEYTVIREYDIGMDKVEITCERKNSDEY